MIVAAVLLAMAGCGYTFQGSGSVLPPDVKKIFIPLVENNSTEPGLAVLVTEALRDRFDRFGVVTVVDSLDQADAVLRGKILSLKRKTKTVTGTTDQTMQVDTTITVSAELKRVAGAALWRTASMTVSKATGTVGNAVVTTSSDFASGSLASQDLEGMSSREISRSQEQEALNQLADDLARQIYDQAVSPDF